MISLNPLMLMYANYLFENGYNTYSEVMSMNFIQLQDRFFNITRNEALAERYCCQEVEE